MAKSEPDVTALSKLTLEQLRPDHNLDSRFKRWYNHFPQRRSKDDPDHLCETCRHLDFSILFQHWHSDAQTAANDYVKLGPFSEIKEETTCKICRLITGTIETVIAHSPSRFVRERETADFVLSKWYLSPSTVCIFPHGQSYQLFLVPNIFDAERSGNKAHTHSSWPFGLRLLGSNPRHGRRVPHDQLDFAWLKGTMDHCDRLTRMPPRNFQQVRVVDVKDMRVVDLPDQEKYVTLSYSWGGVKQLMLRKENESALRQRGSLTKMWEEIPSTIQDFFILVANVRERYAWVDSLSILQDDEAEAKQQQMSQMGEIYQHSHFTVHAVSGSNANYGLPRVRPTPRRFKQLVVQIGNQEISNMLPWLDGEGYDRCGGTWGSRAWTYQERFMSQRSVFLGDFGVDINCLHTANPEDEHCSHPRWRDEDFTSGGVIFWDGQDSRCEPRIHEPTSFDTYTQVVSEYTGRNLTFQKDALKAFLGVQEYFRRECASEFVHGLPEGEFEAALLWSPIGKSERRCDLETGDALFPSWSWLGWIGPVAWPWQMERDSFLSMVNVPLLWRDATWPPPIPRKGSPDGTMYSTVSGPTYSTYNPWFTSNDMCLPASPTRGETLQDIALGTDDHIGVRYKCLLMRRDGRYANDAMVQWPNGGRPIFGHASPFSHVISFRALISRLFLIGEPWQRKRLYNMKHIVYRMSIVDGEGMLAGYIDVPHTTDAQDPIKPGETFFVVLSRSCLDGKFVPPPDALESKRKTTLSPSDRPLDERYSLESYVPEVVHLNEQGNFDEDVYDKARPWCMFNVMMVEVGEGNLLYRRTIGRIHVDAVLTSNGDEPLLWEVVDLA